MFSLVLLTCLIVMTCEVIKVWAYKQQNATKEWVFAFAVCNSLFYFATYFSHAIYITKYLVLALRLRAIRGHPLTCATTQAVYLGLALTYLILTVGIMAVLIVFYYFIIMRDVNIFEEAVANACFSAVVFLVPFSTVVILCVAF